MLRQVNLFSNLLMLASLRVHTASAPLHRSISLYMLCLIPYHYQRQRALFTQERNRAPVIKATRIIISIIPTTPLRPCYNTPCVCTLGVFALSWCPACRRALAILLTRPCCWRHVLPRRPSCTSALSPIRPERAQSSPTHSPIHPIRPIQIFTGVCLLQVNVCVSFS